MCKLLNYQMNDLLTIVIVTLFYYRLLDPFLASPLNESTCNFFLDYSFPIKIKMLASLGWYKSQSGSKNKWWLKWAPKNGILALERNTVVERHEVTLSNPFRLSNATCVNDSAINNCLAQAPASSFSFAYSKWNGG